MEGVNEEVDDSRSGVEVTEGLDDGVPEYRSLPVSPANHAATESSLLAAIDLVSLEKFSFKTRYRNDKQFPGGPYEGRLRLEFGEHIVSAKTYTEVLGLLSQKAVALIAEREAKAAKAAARRA